MHGRIRRAARAATPPSTTGSRPRRLPHRRDAAARTSYRFVRRSSRRHRSDRIPPDRLRRRCCRTCGYGHRRRSDARSCCRVAPEPRGITITVGEQLPVRVPKHRSGFERDGAGDQIDAGDLRTGGVLEPALRGPEHARRRVPGGPIQVGPHTVERTLVERRLEFADQARVEPQALDRLDPGVTRRRFRRRA